MNHYQSGAKFALTTSVFLIIGIALNLITLVLDAIFLADPDAVFNADAPRMLIYSGLAVAAGLAHTGTVIAFLCWLHRAVSNLTALHARNLEFTPGWSVGYYFIPIVNLWMPYRSMKELWLKSQPEYGARFDGIHTREARFNPLGAWWLFWLLSSFSFRISANFDISQSANSVAILFGAELVAASFAIAAAAFLLQIIKTIENFQAERYLRLAQSPEMSTPEYPSAQYGGYRADTHER